MKKKSKSPSQVNLYRRCPRRWAYSRQRPREPETAATIAGGKCHDLAQAWGESGTPPPSNTREGKTILSAIDVLPAPGEAVHEHSVHAELGGVLWGMRLDWIADYTPDLFVEVGDLKTTSNFDHALTPETLAVDTQAVIYGHWAATEFAVPVVRLRWVYALRKSNPPPARVVETYQTADELAVNFAPIAEIGREMTELDGVDPSKLPRNIDDCYSYHRPCAYMAECYGDEKPSLYQITTKG